MASYTNLNITNDPVTEQAIDSGVFSAPFDRASTFTPPSGYVAPTSVGQANFGVAGNDWSVGTTPTVRAKCFEPQSYTALIDPGLAVSG